MRKAFLLIFIFLVLCADLKVTVFPYIHWVAWGVLLFPFMISDFFKKGFVVSPFFGGGLIVFFVGCISSFINGASLETLIQVIKFFLIFLTLYHFLYYIKIEWAKIFNVINMAVVINSLFLLLGLIGVTNVAHLMTSDGRWGTFLAYPGSLVKIGTYGLYLNIMKILLIKGNHKLISIFLILLSIFIMYMDGSRTGMLLTFITGVVILLLYSVVNFRNKIKSVMIPFVITVLFLGLFIIMVPYLLKSRLGNSISNLINSTSLAQGMESIDSIRYIMLKSAINKIHDNPYIGTGAFTTTGMHEDGSNMVVHNTYLQLWGDFGFLGLLGMISIYFGWLVLMPRIMVKLKLVNDNYEKAIACSSIIMLIYFVLNGLFHPYSTEFSEWITFIIPLAYVYNFYKGSIQKGMTHNK